MLTFSKILLGCWLIGNPGNVVNSLQETNNHNRTITNTAITNTTNTASAPLNDDARKRLIGNWKCKDVAFSINGYTEEQLKAASEMFDQMKEQFRKKFNAQFKADGTYTMQAPNPMSAGGLETDSGKWSLSPDGKQIHVTTAKGDKETFGIDIKDRVVIMSMVSSDATVRLTLVP